MSVESFLSRELEIRFIDARAIATEAKLNLGVEGYVDDMDQCAKIVAEAIKVFDGRTDKEKFGMRQLHTKLNTVKAMSSGNSCYSGDSSYMADFDSPSDNFSVKTSSTRGSTSSGSGKKRRSSTLKFWSVRR